MANELTCIYCGNIIRNSSGRSVFSYKRHLAKCVKARVPQRQLTLSEVKEAADLFTAAAAQAREGARK